MRICQLVAGALVVGVMVQASAQVPTQQPTTMQSDTALVAAKRPMVTRAELQAALDDIQRGLTSTAYSQALRMSKQAAADVIRDRLTNGDIHPADEIKVEVLTEPGLSATYTISPRGTLDLPGGVSIDMHGILRSEVQAYLTQQLKRVVNDPAVTATTFVRISMFGALNKPGFFQAPASRLMSEEIMIDAGGPANNVRWNKSTIKRGDRIIVDGDEFADAVQKGLTLDQLNVQAGDEITLATKPSAALFWRIIGGATALGGLVYLVHIVL
ncbi:MAG TPA: polysaccharide biosynthesis/export family protein [Gemmatimonadales bacterium]